jgi:hypothetical protein
LLARKNVFTLVSQAELGFSLMQQKYGFVWTECTPTSSALSLWIYPTDWAIEGVSWKNGESFYKGLTNKQTNIECKTKCKKWMGCSRLICTNWCSLSKPNIYIYIYIPLIHWYSTKVILFDSMETLAYRFQLGTELTSETFCLSIFHHGVTALRKNTPWRWWLLKDFHNNV